jgi:hypothetical protein
MHNDLTAMLVDVLEGLRLPFAHTVRLLQALDPVANAIADAAAAESSWALQLIDRELATWPEHGGLYNMRTGEDVAAPAHRPVESIAYDLAELWRRRRTAGGGMDAAEPEGAGPEAGRRGRPHRP